MTAMFGDARLPSRFWDKVSVSDSGCWLWVASVMGTGYGWFYDGGSNLAHRASYSALVGPIPEGLQIDHLCRERRCVNPGHLEAVTQRENILRGTSPAATHAKKTHCPRGHEMSGDNLVAARVRIGKRMCRRCANEHDRIVSAAAKSLGLTGAQYGAQYGYSRDAALKVLGGVSGVAMARIQRSAQTSAA